MCEKGSSVFMYIYREKEDKGKERRKMEFWDSKMGIVKT